jgi:predicted dienelactone hydrolase
MSHFAIEDVQERDLGRIFLLNAQIQPTDIHKRITKMTIKTFATTLAIAAMLASGAHSAGYKTHQIEAAHRDTPLDLFIWYPSQTEASVDLGKNAVFTGISVAEDAPQSEGRHPLIVLSHGSGGNAINIGWIAAHLADQGYIVVATNHPHTTSRDSIPAETVKVWERPADMTTILDHFEQTGIDGLIPDMGRVASMGFSLGGFTALSLAGGIVNQQSYIQHCLDHPDLHDCQWFADAGVDLTKIDTDRFEQSNRDPRIKTAIAIDPALSQAYVEASLLNMQMPVQIINLGDPETVPSTINAQKIAKILPNVEYTSVSEATHFSFLGECTTLGHLIIAVAGDDPICKEIGNRKRTEIHTELKNKITAFLETAL